MNELKEKAIFIKEIFKPIKKKIYQRQHVYAYFKKDLFSADLVDYQYHSKFNKGYNYLLNVIDIYSRYVWVIPLKTKTAVETLNAFKTINEIPKNLWVDEGKEFFNSEFMKFNEKNSINMYHTYSEIKGAFIERFNRTLKEKIIKYMEGRNTRTYINELPNIVKQYNHTKHSTTKQTPYDVYFNNKIPQTMKQIKPDSNNLKVGDYVRINRIKDLFEKGYTHRWSKEVFKIIEIIAPPFPTMYKLQDMSDEIINGKFYLEELEKTAIPNFKVFEKVIKQKKVDGKQMYLIQFDGYYLPKFHKWVNKTELDRLKDLSKQ